MPTAAHVQELASQLPRRSRLKLAEYLLQSDHTRGHEPDEILREAERRDSELESGAVRGLSEAEFWKGVRRVRRA
jgi:hypothetical protein